MTAFVNILKSLLSLYGIGSRSTARRRRAPIQIGAAGFRRPA